MSEFNERPDAEPPDEPLDQLLRDATWPEPDGEAVHRLRRHWSSLRIAERKRERLRRMLFWLTASAAAVALIAGVWGVWRPAPEPGRPVAPFLPERDPEQMAADDTDIDADAPETRSPESGDAAPDGRDEPVIVTSTSSRPATPYELLLIRSIERRSSIRPGVTTPNVDSMIDEFLNDPGADAAEFVDALTIDHATCELKLLRLIDDASSGQRTQIIELLRHVGSQRCVPRLIELSRLAETRADAVRSLTTLADAETIAGLAVAETDEHSRRQLLSELLSRENDEALAFWLDLLQDARTRESALAGLDEQTMPPLDRLFRFLQGPDYSRRWAAAVVLGRLDQPEVTERLIRLAQSNVNRQEALAGLLASHDEHAGRFLSVAAQDQTMIGAVYSARLQLQLMSQEQSRTQQRWRNLP